MNQTAIKSPCYDCNHWGAELFPHCQEDCQPLAAYLCYLGEPPIIKPETDLHLKYKGGKTYSAPPCKVNLCTPEQFSEAVEHLKKLKEKYTGPQIAIMSQVAITCINTALRGGQKRMCVNNYRKIMEVGG